MGTDDKSTKTPAQRRTPGMNTMMRTADELASKRAREERNANEVRDTRQDDRTDKAWTAAIDAAKSGQASAERTTKMLYALVAACLLAIVVLAAMVLDSKLNISKQGVSVGGSADQAEESTQPVSFP